jgi:hypothetical protein
MYNTWHRRIPWLLRSHGCWVSDPPASAATGLDRAPMNEVNVLTYMLTYVLRGVALSGRPPLTLSGTLQ